MINLIWLIGGLGLLVIGGEALVRGASALAGLFRVQPLLIGLTVVAFGTSAPELATSVGAALTGKADLAIGNVVGSNIANILLILGVAALITPLTVQSQLVRFDVPLMIIASVIVWGMSWDGNISRFDGCLLLLGIIVYTVWLIRQSRNEPAEVVAEFGREFDVASADSPLSKVAVLKQFAFILVGLILLILGANWLVDSASNLARAWGVSDLAIGLTIVAVGTSLPELTTSILAAYRGESEIAVGNIVGSNLFNLLSVLGATATIANEGVDVSQAAIWYDMPLMIVVAAACLPIFFTGYRISRWEGLAFLVGYVVYVTTAFL